MAVILIEIIIITPTIINPIMVHMAGITMGMAITKIIIKTIIKIITGIITGDNYVALSKLGDKFLDEDRFLTF